VYVHNIHAVVAGAGFVGLEVAEQLVNGRTDRPNCRQQNMRVICRSFEV
jgi:hypothetical protein